MSPLLRDTSRTLLALIGALIFVCPLSVLLIMVPLYLNQQGQMSDSLLDAALVAWFVILVGGALAGARLALWRRDRRLDAAFTPLGLAGRPYLLTGRAYRGTLDGRPVTVRFSRGPSLQISVQARVKTRFGIALAEQPGLSLAGQPPLATRAPWLQPYRVFALDPAWTAALLESPAAEGPLARLMQSGADWALFRQMILQPWALRLSLYRNKNLFDYPITAEEARGWVADLSALAGLAESLPRPTVTAEETRAEAAERSGTGMRALALFVVGLFLLVGVWMGFVLWLVAVVLK